jgi:hypothetical protein
VTQAGQGARLSGIYSAQEFDAWIPSGLYPSDVTSAGDDFSTGELVWTNSKYAWPSISCSDAVDATAAPGFGEQAYSIAQAENATAKDFYAYSVYEFKTAAEAAQFVRQAAAKFQGCGSFTYQSSNGSLPVTLSVGPSSEASEVSSADVAVALREKLVSNGKTVVGDIVAAADGNMVVLTDGAGSTLPTEVDEGKLAQEILAALTTGEAQNPTPNPYSTDTASPTMPSTAGDEIRAYSTDAARFGGEAR